MNKEEFAYPMSSQAVIQLRYNHKTLKIGETDGYCFMILIKITLINHHAIHCC